MIPLFRKGSKQTLDEEDLYEVLPNFETKKLGDQLENEWMKNKGKVPFARLMFKCFGVNIFWLGVLTLTASVVDM